MIEILSTEMRAKKAKGGRKNKLSIEDQLLMAFEYIIEYRMYFHVSQSYGVSESSAYKTIKWIEDTLIQRKEFTLPGRKALRESDIEYELIIVDVTETTIERPKKTKEILFREEKETHDKDGNYNL
ncbi:MAG: transposase family protein [Deinococcaceae bacterium]